jgi:hypothetical protein
MSSAKKLKIQKISNTIYVKGFAKIKHHLWGKKFCENKTLSMGKILEKSDRLRKKFCTKKHHL